MKNPTVKTTFKSICILIFDAKFGIVKRKFICGWSKTEEKDDSDEHCVLLFIAVEPNK